MMWCCFYDLVRDNGWKRWLQKMFFWHLLLVQVKKFDICSSKKKYKCQQKKKMSSTFSFFSSNFGCKNVFVPSIDFKAPLIYLFVQRDSISEILKQCFSTDGTTSSVESIFLGFCESKTIKG